MPEFKMAVSFLKMFSLSDIPNIVNKEICEGKLLNWAQIRGEITHLVDTYARHYKLNDEIRDEITEVFIKYSGI